jgi:hypothetical protein
MDFLEYVLVGTRTWRYSQDEEFKEGPPWCWVELECEATVKGFGIARIFSLVLSPTVKSHSEKCRLHRWCLNNLLVVSASQGIPTPAHSWALCKNGTRIYKNEISYLWLGFVFYVAFLMEVKIYLSQKLLNVCCGGYNILVKYWFILNPALDIW